MPSLFFLFQQHRFDMPVNRYEWPGKQENVVGLFFYIESLTTKKFVATGFFAFVFSVKSRKKEYRITKNREMKTMTILKDLAQTKYIKLFS